MAAIETLGDLRRSGYRSRPVKQEIRDNLVSKLQSGETLFPGIIGYDDTVVPQLVNAVLSRHNFILLGLRGQAKSRILRALVELLDDAIPVVSGCEINDDPLAPICRACTLRVAGEGDALPISWLPRAARSQRERFGFGAYIRRSAKTSSRSCARATRCSPASWAMTTR